VTSAEHPVVNDPLVTIVVATYDRPDTLRVAIRSVIAQSFTRWRLLVVGDQCGEETGALVHSFGDPRVSYINLPIRFGEQSGPNSIGMRMAETEYVALLNHDDVFLQDHLARGVSRLANTQADIFFGRTAAARYVANGSTEPMFRRANASHYDFGDLFRLHSRRFEPCSSWVFRRELVDTIGRWRPAENLYRAPLHDWLLRAWRQNVKVACGDEITVLRIGQIKTSQHKDLVETAGGQYRIASHTHRAVNGMLESSDADAIRRTIMTELDRTHHDDRIGAMRAFSIFIQTAGQRLFLNRVTAFLFRRFNADAFTLFCLITGKRKGYRLSNTARRRTGKALPPAPNLEEVYERVRYTRAIEHA
jgi:glycosyltransferase involved in cell wall biosynthesis